MNGEQNNMSNMEGAKHTSGLTAAVVVILAIAVLAGLYFWSQRSGTSETADEEAALEVSLEAIETQGATDDTASIEADLDATDIDGLDAEFNAS